MRGMEAARRGSGDHEDEHDECCRLAAASKAMTPASECLGCHWVAEVRENEREHVLRAMESVAVNAVLQSAVVTLRTVLEPDEDGRLL